MNEVGTRQRIALAKALMNTFNTGDWTELFQLTECEDFTDDYPNFYKDVNWKNDGLKQGCIRAVNFILDRNPDNLVDITSFEYAMNNLKRNSPKDFEIIMSIVEDDESKLVTSPSVENTNESVYEALADAEVLISERGPANGYDRMHTALHSFLREVCTNKSISFDKKDSINELLPKINDFIKSKPDDGRNDEVFKMLRAANGMMNNINYLRNHHSLSHPTDKLLNHNDAQFAINLARSIMSYIDSLMK